MPVGLLDEAKDHTETEARALADFLGGKEGIEDLFQVAGGNPGAGIAHGNHDIVSHRDLAVHARIVFIEINVVGLDYELAAGRHGIAGIQRKVQYGCRELAWIDQGCPCVLRKQWVDLDLFPKRWPQQLRGFED